MVCAGTQRPWHKLGVQFEQEFTSAEARRDGILGGIGGAGQA